VPTGQELQRRFAEVEVLDAEIMSDAERARLHGDQAGAEAAGLDAEGADSNAD
jgi:hypothetical protein